MTRVNLSESDIQGLQKAMARNPRERVRYELIKAHAEAVGGTTLAYWQATYGWLWNQPWMMSLAEAAQAAGISAEEAMRLEAEARDAVLPAWKQSPAFNERPPDA